LGANPLGLTELEVATGTVMGTDQRAPKLVDADEEPLAALFEVARVILAQGRCVVAFSGGRDSSALLAVLLQVARQDGFDEPLAITARWPGDEATDESAWQDHVARSIGLRHWEVISPGTDFDLLGPRSKALLRRYGLMWPAPVAALLPMVEAAGDGTLVTGEGGDEVFGGWSTAPAWQRVRQPSSWRPGLRQLGGAALPPPVRRRRAEAASHPYQYWLTKEAVMAQKTALAGEQAATGLLWWPSYVREMASARALRLSAATLSTLCAEAGGRFAAPLLAPRFLAALGRWGGRRGRGDRTAVMRALFARLLDDEIMSRVSKATFGGVFWGPASRQFAETWDGTGLDPHLVDAEALRKAWQAPLPLFGAALPLHAAWLASSPQ
jgi:asparagine synthase (glutamine-hydrolysing)